MRFITVRGRRLIKVSVGEKILRAVGSAFQKRFAGFRESPVTLAYIAQQTFGIEARRGFVDRANCKGSRPSVEGDRLSRGRFSRNGNSGTLPETDPILPATFLIGHEMRTPDAAGLRAGLRGVTVRREISRNNHASSGPFERHLHSVIEKWIRCPLLRTFRPGQSQCHRLPFLHYAGNARLVFGIEADGASHDLQGAVYFGRRVAAFEIAPVARCTYQHDSQAGNDSGIV